MEVLCILVLSTEDTTEDGSRWEVTEPRTVAKEGSETDKETSEGTIRSRKVTLCCTHQSMDYAGLTSQAQVPQGNHGPIWLVKTGYAEVSHKGT